MKYWSSSILIILLLMSGCGTKEDLNIPNLKNETTFAGNEIKLSSPLPDEIELLFAPLDFNLLQKGEPSPEWKFIKSIPFGNMNKESIVVDIYQGTSADESLHQRFNGVLKVETDRYLIQDLSPSIIDSHTFDSTRERFFPGQDQFELIGSMELFANGPGRKIFVVHDVKNNDIKTFEGWGEPSFIDLDDDGADEFVMEFSGLHLSFPDITIIRSEQGILKISSSVVNSLSSNQRSVAKLIKNQTPPVIRISNVESGEHQSHDYIFSNGVLKKKGISD